MGHQWRAIGSICDPLRPAGQHGRGSRGVLHSEPEDCQVLRADGEDVRLCRLWECGPSEGAHEAAGGEGML